MKRLAERESWLVRKLKSANHRRAALALRPSGARCSASRRWRCCGAGAGALGLQRAFLPAFNEGTFTINLAFNPGVSLSEIHARRLDRRAPPARRARSDQRSDGAPGARNSTSMPRASIRPTSKSISKPSQRPKPEIVADIRSRLSVLPLSINVGPADLAPARPHALGRPRRDRAEAVRRRSRHAAWQRRRAARAARRRSRASRTCRSKSRCAFRSSKSASTMPAPRSTACSPAPWSISCRRLSNGRVISRVVDGYQRFDVVMRLPDQLRTTAGARRPPDRDPVGLDPARQIADVKETDGPEPDPARERPQAPRRARQHRRQDRHGGDRAAHSRRAGSREACREGVTASLEGTFQAQEEAGRSDRHAVGGVAGADLRDSLQPLPLGRAGR